MSSPTLLGAIFARFQSDAALLAAVPGSPYLDEAPEGTALPYVIVAHGGEKPTEHTTENSYREDADFTLKAYGVGEAATEAIGTLIKAAFDEEPLEIDNAHDIRCERLDYRVKLDRMRSSLTRRVTEVSLPYKVWTQKTY